MSSVSNAAFYNADFARRLIRSRKIMKQHPSLLNDGFQVESPQARPELVGVEESVVDTLSPEELLLLHEELLRTHGRPRTLNWDTEAACFVAEDLLC